MTTQIKPNAQVKIEQKLFGYMESWEKVNKEENTYERIKNTWWYRILQILSLIWIIFMLFVVTAMVYESLKIILDPYYYENELSTPNNENEKLAKDAIKSGMTESEFETMARKTLGKEVDQNIEDLLKKADTLKPSDKYGMSYSQLQELAHQQEVIRALIIQESEKQKALIQPVLNAYHKYDSELKLIEMKKERLNQSNFKLKVSVPIIFSICFSGWYLLRLCFLYIITGKLIWWSGNTKNEK